MKTLKDNISSVEKTNFGPGKTSLYYNNVGLFSDPFLEDRLPRLQDFYKHPSTRFLNDYWNIDESDALKFNKAFQDVMNLWNKLDQDVPKFCSKERQLQNSWIDKIFEILGWTIELEETSSKNGITNFPDYALFANVDDWKKSKNLTGNNKFKKATAVADAKDWGISLDGKGFSNKNPSFQIINYLKQTDKTWGVLTDGKYWRIYSLKSESKHTTYYEIDLEKILATGDYERFKYFYNFFRVEAFTSDARLSDRSFLDFVFEDGQYYSQRVEKNLNERVYKVVDSICKGFLVNYNKPSEQDLKDVYEFSMYYLFKLMFVLNCESKGLLEVNKQDDYYESSLRKRCLEIKEQSEQGKNWSQQARTYNYIIDLFELLSVGDKNIGVYGFGKEAFDIGSSDFYKKNKISDEHLNAALLELACDYDEEKNLQFIDYKILSPDHIGSLFEGLLEFNLVKVGSKVELLHTSGERKATGAYYTPDHIADYIIENSLKNLVINKTPSEILEIKIVDPAMGSGHFLLGVVKYLENTIIQIQDSDKKIHGSLEFDKIRKEILKSCVFGVDINPLATQLAKFSLWIYTSNKGEELESLSNQLFCGDSLLSQVDGFDWKKQFKPIFKNGGFDAAVGNPPYIFTRDNKFNDTQKEIFKEVFHWSRFKANTYQFFIEKSFGLVKDGGIVGFIIPNNWMTVDSSDIFRKAVIENTKSMHIVNSYDKLFADASVDTCISIFEKSKKTDSTQLSMFSLENGEFHHSYTKKLLASTEIINTKKENDTFKIIEMNSVPISDVFEIRAGMQCYEVGKGHPKQTEKMKNDRIYHHKTRANKNCRKYLLGKDVCRYELKWSGDYVEYGKNLSAPRDPSLFSTHRILIRQIPSKPPFCINAAYTNGEEVNDINSMIIPCKNEKEAFLLMAILNSNIVSDWFIYKFDKFQRKTFPQIKVKELSLFPYPKNLSEERQKEIVALSKLLFNSIRDEKTKVVASLNDEIEEIICDCFGINKKMKKTRKTA